MDNLIARVTENLIARVTGPMKFRLVLQPGMAIFLAVREGLKDARQGKPPYFWGCLTDRGERKAMLEEGWKSIGKVFTLAVVLDIVYQLIEHRWRVYLGEAALGRDHSGLSAVLADSRANQPDHPARTWRGKGKDSRRLNSS